ncbi:hypothetical protein D3C81_1802090 [compost metagenome]
MDAGVFDLVSIVAKTSGGYVFPHQDIFEEREMKLIERYGASETITIPSKTLSYKHPVYSEFLHWEGNFSIKYLQAAYSGFKKIKSKHENRLQKLDSLLGL